MHYCGHLSRISTELPDISPVHLVTFKNLVISGSMQLAVSAMCMVCLFIFSVILVAAMLMHLIHHVSFSHCSKMGCKKCTLFSVVDETGNDDDESDAANCSNDSWG